MESTSDTPRTASHLDQPAFYPERIDQTVGPTGRHPTQNTYRLAYWVASYVVIGSLLSLSQFDYINADFVAYATIARQTLETPEAAVTAYWSSLFAWMIAPLIYLGVGDLLAGRLILLGSGIVYLAAIDRLITIHADPDRPGNRMIRNGTMTCAFIQSVIWANYLLVPDLIACGILYIYFCCMTDGRLRGHPSVRGFLAGCIAGFAYLSKAYMLPFCLVHFVLTQVMDWRNRDSCTASRTLRNGVLVFSLYGIGLGLVSGPWIVLLSEKHGRFTFSTAGAANHANVSPEHFQRDVLWNPGLVTNFIIEPFLGPDWSALQDISHFQHQLTVIFHNLSNCIGLIPVWFVFYLVSLLAVISGKSTVTRRDRQYLEWVAMTVIVYCGGYMVINLESRYIVPAIVPLLCQSSLIMLCRLRPTEDRTHLQKSLPETEGGRSEFPPRTWVQIPLMIVLLSGVDLHNLYRVICLHPQSTPLSRFQLVADRLHHLGIDTAPNACSHLHFGLFIAYASNRLPDYWGAPRSPTERERKRELAEKDVNVYLQVETDAEGDAPPLDKIDFGEDDQWTRTATIDVPELSPHRLQVYVRR